MWLVHFQLWAWCCNPRVHGFAYIHTHVGPLNWVSWKSGIFSHHPNPHWFSQPEVMGIYLPGAGTLGCISGLEGYLGITCPQGILPNFYTLYMNVRPSVLQPLLPLHTTPHLCTSPPVSTTLPLLLIWMNVASLNPRLLDFHAAWFSDGSGCYLFWYPVVILSLVVHQGEACLPTPSSWPAVRYSHWNLKQPPPSMSADHQKHPLQ